jgi:hypothetical protein
MYISFINKQTKDIKSDIEIVLLKRHKLLKANDMFIQKNKLYVKIVNFKYYTITETLTNTIKYINKINKYKSVKISLYDLSRV